jgi:glyoxylase-like metal-dependent hydrolase (beta-lactamase superfamily II)
MPEYSIWALEYARVTAYPDARIVYGATAGARVLPFYYFVLRSPDHVLLIDCGFADNPYGRSMISNHQIEGFAEPAEVLARIGLSPDEVDGIVLTHHHFDHAGGLGYFPNAEVWIQRREVDSWMAKWCAPPRFRWLREGLDPDTGATLAGLGAQGRLHLLEGAAEIVPGVRVRPAFDTHTEGSQYVTIDRGDDAPWVVPGDVAYVYDNLGGLDGLGPMIPVGLAQGSQELCLRSTDEMLTLAGDDVHRVLPMHEVRLWDRFPTQQFEDGLHVAEISSIEP